MPTFDKSKQKWRGVVKHEGERYQRLFDTKKDAKAWEVEKKHELKKKETETPDDMPFRIICSKYLDFCELHFSSSVFKEKKTLLQRVVALWTGGTDPDRPDRNKPLKDITTDVVGRYLEEQAKERSRNASNKERKNLLAMFNWAAKRLDTRHNPVVKIDRLSHDRQPRYVPSEKDVLKLLEVATREEEVLLDCYLCTAARRSEIFRLTWQDDVNLEKREIRLGTRKTKDGSMDYVWLPMNESLHDSLNWLYRNRKFPDSPFVFVCDQPGPRYGQPYTTRRKFMAGLCKRACVKPFGFHALRHFVASILADKHKASTKTIQRVLRHKHLHTTEGYLHNLHTDLAATMELLDFKTDTSGTTENLDLISNGETWPYDHRSKTEKNVARGERHGRSKLTEAQVLKIRSDGSSSHAKLAREFNVSERAIRLIRKGTNWKVSTL